MVERVLLLALQVSMYSSLMKEEGRRLNEVQDNEEISY